ncbi:MAG TPA: hypothetical protein VFQ44_10835 [Streptosporangiaceae bacterium]|nr:hypothetical protein [Streptosporangiaceae bacterium]
MTEVAGLERGYRRLLAAYPQSFRREQGEELLAVLMACARQGQRRPGLAEAANVIVSGLWMRLRRAGPGRPNRDWADSLAVLSLVAPLSVLAVALLEVAVPYRLPAPNRDPRLFHFARAPRAIGGLPLLLHLPGLDIVLGCQVIIAVLVLLGRRRLALVTLAVAAGFWIATRYAGLSGLWLPDPLQVLTVIACMLEAVALTVSSTSGQARSLLSWRHGMVLLFAAAAVQVLTLLYDASGPFAEMGVLVRATAHSSQWAQVHGPGIRGYVIAAVVLAVAAAGLAVAFKTYRYLLLLAILLYPVALELAAAGYRGIELMGLPGPGHLAVLYVPPLVLLTGIMISAYTGLRLRLVRGTPESA